MPKIIGNTTATSNPRPDWNQTDVTKADYIKNKPDLTAFANALKGTSIGETVRITDISPIEHNMIVSVKNGNMIPFLYYTESGKNKGITYTVNRNGSITVNGTCDEGSASTLYLTEWSDLGLLNDWFKDGETYDIRGSAGGVKVVLQYKKIGDSTFYHYYGDQSFVIDKKNINYCCVRLQVPAGKTVNNVTIYPRIERHTKDFSTVKLYQMSPNVDKPIEYDVSTDGIVEGVTATYPRTTLETDTYGTVISCTYNRDINKAIAELQDAIISLGWGGTFNV